MHLVKGYETSEAKPVSTVLETTKTECSYRSHLDIPCIPSNLHPLHRYRCNYCSQKIQYFKQLKVKLSCPFYEYSMSNLPRRIEYLYDGVFCHSYKHFTPLIEGICERERGDERETRRERDERRGGGFLPRSFSTQVCDRIPKACSKVPDGTVSNEPGYSPEGRVGT